MDRATLLLADLLFTLALVPALLVQRSRSEVDVARARHAALEARVARLDATLASVPGLQSELEAAQQRLPRIVRRLLPSPEIATPERVLELIQGCCEQSGFMLRGGCCNRASSRRGRGGFQEVDISLSYEGTFEPLRCFLSLLERADHLVRVNSFSLTRRRDGLLDATINVSTFRYDPES